jgi:hypothetical protein
MIYAASKLLKREVVVLLPPRVDVEFNELELRVMEESARLLLPSAGYYLPSAGYNNGFSDDIANRTNIGKSYSHTIRRSIIEKTRTWNLGRAVTYFVAHGLVSIRELNLVPERTPALEAIIRAMNKSTAYR